MGVAEVIRTEGIDEAGDPKNRSARATSLHGGGRKEPDTGRPAGPAHSPGGSPRSRRAEARLPAQSARTVAAAATPTSARNTTVAASEPIEHQHQARQERERHGIGELAAEGGDGPPAARRQHHERAEQEGEVRGEHSHTAG